MQLLRGGHATFLRLSSTGLTLLFGILGAKLLGSEIFGRYVSIMAIAGIAASLSSMGLPSLVAREVAASRGSAELSRLLPLVQGALVINGVLAVTVTAYMLIGSVDIGLVLLFALVGNLAGLVGAMYSGFERVIAATWIGGVVRPLVALLSLALLSQALFPSVHLPILAQTAGAAMAVVALVILWTGSSLSRAVLGALRSAWWSSRHQQLLRAGVIFAFTQILINLTTQVDIILLTALTTPDAVAHYYAAARAALVVSFFSGSAALITEPQLTRLLAAGEIEAAQQVAQSTAVSGVAATLAAAMACVVLAPFYLDLYGHDFRSALPSLLILVGGLIGWSLFGPAQSVMRAAHKDNKLLLQTGIAVIVNVAVATPLISLFGIVGAAIGTALQFVVYGALLARTVKRETPVYSDVFHCMPKMLIKLSKR